MSKITNDGLTRSGTGCFSCTHIASKGERVLSQYSVLTLPDGVQEGADEAQLDDCWNPKLYVENAIGELKSSTRRCLQYDDAGLATVCETRFISGTFFEFMELNKFPFDSQVSSYYQMPY